jgi:hypothetical protein
MKKAKLILIIAGILIGLNIFIYIGGLFAPGSNYEAERYVFKVKQSRLIDAMIRLNESNSTVVVLDTSYWNPQGLYYYKDENEAAVFTIEALTKEETRVLFVSIVYPDDSTKACKLINKDFANDNNIYQKRRFEQKFLDPLGLKYKNVGNGNFLWFKNFR